MKSATPRRVLVVEDHRDIADLVALHLRDAGMTVDVARDGEAGLVHITEQDGAEAGTAACGYDLVILDIMLPGVDGLELCRRLRARDDYTPVLMLTAKSSELDRVAGLELGADDYLTKPFSIRELVARVNAIFRRVDALGGAEEAADGIVNVGELIIDLARRRVSLQEAAIELTAREFDLLWHFARHPGRVFSRSQLLDNVWGYGHDGYEHTVNSHINRLRAKIEADPAHPRYILTVWGVGYKFAEERDLRAT